MDFKLTSNLSKSEIKQQFRKLKKLITAPVKNENKNSDCRELRRLKRIHKNAVKAGYVKIIKRYGK